MARVKTHIYDNIFLIYHQPEGKSVLYQYLTTVIVLTIKHHSELIKHMDY